MSNSQKITEMFVKLRIRLEVATEKTLIAVGNAGENHMRDNFKSQSWEGKPWQKRKNKKNTKPLLVDRNNLYDSIESKPPLNYRIRWGTYGIKYAQVHNDGLEITRGARSETFVRNRYKRGPKSKLFGGLGAFQKGTTAGQGLTFKSYSYRMPQRRFIGNTPELRKIIKEVAAETMKESLRNS